MNLNDKVSVILTEYGKHILDEYRTNIEKELNFKFKETFIYDERGKYTTQMWNLMNVFRKYMWAGSKQVFKDNDIFLEE